MSIPAEPSFENGEAIYSWRVQWDEEMFCHVEAKNIIIAIEKGMAMIKTSIYPEYVVKVKEWIVIYPNPENS